MKKSLIPIENRTSSQTLGKEELEKLLEQHFGHAHFRGKQLEAIQAVLSGRDCFCLMPTGGGKSMCYQIPALVRPGIVLVISPLIALMENQVANLKERGVAAEYLSSAQTSNVKGKIHEDLASGKPSMKLLYVTPELVATIGFKSKLMKLHTRDLLSLIAVDEAHCISTWGHDFRSSYRKLSSLRNQFPDVPILALTATAVPKVQNDVIESLGLHHPLILKSSFNRPNIFYEVRYKDLLNDAYSDLSSVIKSSGLACSIIYCLERSTCDNLSARLAKDGISCSAYHAGLNNKARSSVLDDWISSKVQVVVATVAFGMGIDRKDVRIVCHFNIPKSMEAFYQESGRAGRDQLPSRSLLYYGIDDRKKLEFILSNAGNAGTRMSQSSSSSDGLSKKALSDFTQMVEYCEGPICRRQKILDSFGERVAASFCKKTCDACKYPDVVSTYLKELSHVPSICQKNGLPRIFINSMVDMAPKDKDSEFWDREDEASCSDEDISDSDVADGAEVMNNLARSKFSSKARLNEKIDILERAEEIYYQNKGSVKQVSGLADKKAISDTLREAGKQRLLNALKQAQDRFGNLMVDPQASVACLELECYKKYGKVGRTFYNSQVASTVRWLSSATHGEINDRLNASSSLPANVHHGPDDSSLGSSPSSLHQDSQQAEASNEEAIAIFPSKTTAEPSRQTELPRIPSSRSMLLIRKGKQADQQIHRFQASKHLQVH